MMGHVYGYLGQGVAILINGNNGTSRGGQGRYRGGRPSCMKGEKLT